MCLPGKVLSSLCPCQTSTAEGSDRSLASVASDLLHQGAARTVRALRVMKGRSLSFTGRVTHIFGTA